MYTVFFVLPDEHIRIFLPVFETAVCIRVEPGGYKNPPPFSLRHNAVKSMGELYRVGLPVIRILPDMLKTSTLESRAGAFTRLPPVIHLKMRNTQTATQPELV